VIRDHGALRSNDFIQPFHDLLQDVRRERPIFLPILSTDSVLIWLIFTQDGFGRERGQAGTQWEDADCSWLVMASAITSRNVH
jgi:hypothetical protein